MLKSAEEAIPQKIGYQRLLAAAGGQCGIQGKGSRLKDTKTPVKQQQSIYDMPNTPGSKLGAGLDDGLLSASPEQLPANLMLLHQLLGKYINKYPNTSGGTGMYGSRQAGLE
jgi:hypothetical protein